MSESKRSKRGKKSTRKTRGLLSTSARHERRYAPTSSNALRFSLAVAGVSAAVMGAGVVGRFFRETPHPYGVYLISGGALAMAGVLLVAPQFPSPVRVGDAGIGIEESKEVISRLGWNRVDRIFAEDSVLVVEGAGKTLRFNLEMHPEAIPAIIKEALDRISKKVELNDSQQQHFGTYSKTAGESIKLDELQVIGTTCKASGELITYEPDARLCPKCGEVYHKSSVPTKCETCKAELLGIPYNTLPLADEKLLPFLYDKFVGNRLWCRNAFRFSGTAEHRKHLPRRNSCPTTSSIFVFIHRK
jgi:predicted Zn-ribbon and HTH transcriptional regulator